MSYRENFEVYMRPKTIKRLHDFVTADIKDAEDTFEDDDVVTDLKILEQQLWSRLQQIGEGRLQPQGSST